MHGTHFSITVDVLRYAARRRVLRFQCISILANDLWRQFSKSPTSACRRRQSAARGQGPGSIQATVQKIGPWENPDPVILQESAELICCLFVVDL